MLLIAALKMFRGEQDNLKNIVANKKWLDVGTGAGGILDALGPLASKVSAVEPQEKARNTLRELGYDVYSNIKQVKNSDFDVVTLFHVFEHFTCPIEDLRTIAGKMTEGGKIIEIFGKAEKKKRYG